MATRTFAGGAPATRLSGGIDGSVLAFSVVTGGGAGYPAVGPFVIVIDRGLASEEKLLCASRSSDAFVVTTRGYDDTTGSVHGDQAVVEHCLDTIILEYFTDHADNVPADPHSQYTNNARHDIEARHTFGAAYGTPATPTASNFGDVGAAGTGNNPAREDHMHDREVATATFHTAHTFVIPGDVAVAAGQLDFVCPFFLPEVANQVTSLIAARHMIQSGTSATVKLQKNGSDITGFTAISVTTTATTTDPANVALANNDRIALVVTGVSAAPQNLTFTLYLEHIVTIVGV